MLLVDDEVDFVDTLAERLCDRGLQAEAVYGGDEALTAIERQPPDVVVLDLKMPGTDGLEVLRRLSALGVAVPVVVLTGHGSEDDKRLALELGARACLSKPADINDLMRHLADARG